MAEVNPYQKMVLRLLIAILRYLVSTVPRERLRQDTYESPIRAIADAEALIKDLES